MNRYGFNRSALNGAVRALVLATASISGSASVNAVASKLHDALAPAVASGGIVAYATVTQQLSADLVCAGNLYVTPSHRHAAQASVAGDANVTAYVFRDVQASATIQAGASIVAIPAGTFGTASPSGSASVTAVATRVQLPKSDASGSAGVTVSIQPTVWRMVQANAISGNAEVRAEFSIGIPGGKFHYGYVDLIGGSTFTALAVRTCLPTADLSCVADTVGIGTLRQPGFAQVMADSLVVIAQPELVSLPYVSLVATAAVTANIHLVKQPLSALQCTGNVQASASQKHAGASSITGTASFSNATTTTRNGVSNITLCNVSVQAIATRNLKPTALPTGTASITLNPLRTAYGEAALDAGASLDVVALRRAFGQADITCTADVSANGLKDFSPIANITGSAGLLAYGGRFIEGSASMVCSAGMIADVLTNAASLDPANRTFYSPVRVTQFIRPFTETEFRRTA